jgi:hypothetical protein
MNEIIKLTMATRVALNSLSVPPTVNIDGMAISNDILAQKDTLLPVIAFYSNAISNFILKKDVFKIKLSKSSESLCYVVIEDDEDEEDDDIIPLAMKFIFCYEGVIRAYNLVNNENIDLTQTVYSWRESMGKIPNGRIISCDEAIELTNFNLIKDINPKIINKPIK